MRESACQFFFDAPPAESSCARCLAAAGVLLLREHALSDVGVENGQTRFVRHGHVSPPFAFGNSVVSEATLPVRNLGIVGDSHSHGALRHRCLSIVG